MQIQGSQIWYSNRLCNIKDSIHFMLDNLDNTLYTEHKKLILEHSLEECKELINEMRSMCGDNQDANRKVVAKTIELIETEPNRQFISFVFNSLLREIEELKKNQILNKTKR